MRTTNLFQTFLVISFSTHNPNLGLYECLLYPATNVNYSPMPTSQNEIRIVKVRDYLNVNHLGQPLMPTNEKQ
jgi:hypothetical protein